MTRPSRDATSRVLACAVAGVGGVSALTYLPLAFSHLNNPLVSDMRVAHIFIAILGTLAASGMLLVQAVAARQRRGIPPVFLEDLLRLERQWSDRVASQLHDTAIQSLVVAAYLAREDATSGVSGATLTDQLLTAEREVRDVILDAREPHIETRGFSAGCEHLSQLLEARDGVRVAWSWRARPSTFVPAVAATVAYQFLKEVLNNVAQHAQVDSAHVTLEADPTQLLITVWDAGAGFEIAHAPLAHRAPTGMNIVSTRAVLMGANVSVTSALGNGTRVTLRVPLSHDLEQTVVPLGPPPQGALPTPAPTPAPAPTRARRWHAGAPKPRHRTPGETLTPHVWTGPSAR